MNALTSDMPHDGDGAAQADDIVTRLIRDHRHIGATTQELTALVEQRDAPAIDAVATRRWRLARQILTHLPLEDSYVYRPLEADERPAVAHLAGAFRRELDTLYADFLAHMQAWTGAAVIADWAGYRAAFPPLRDRLIERMRREEAELFPLIDPRAISAARPRRNWTRETHLLKQAIGDGAPLATRLMLE